MAETKEIKVQASFGERYNSKFQKSMEGLTKAGGLFNEKSLKGLGRELDKIVKSFAKMNIDVSGIAKSINKDWQKGLKDSTRQVEGMTKAVAQQAKVVQRMSAVAGGYEDSSRKDRFINRAVGRLNPDTPDTIREHVAEQARVEWETRRAANSNALSQARGNVASGMQQIALTTEDKAAEERQRKLTRMISAGQYASIGIQAIGSISANAFNLPAQKFENTAKEAGLRNSMYNELSSGGGVARFAGLMQNREKVEELVWNSKASTYANLFTQVGGAAATTATGLGVMKFTAGTMGGQMVGQGLTSGTNAGFGFFNNIVGANQANTAEVVLQASQALMDPRAKRAAEYTETNAQKNAYRMRTNRSSFHSDDFARASGVDYIGIGGARRAEEIADQLAGQGGWNLSHRMLRKSGEMELKYGLSANNAAQVLGSFGIASGASDASLGNRGSLVAANKANKELEEVMARAFVKGWKDSSILTALSAALSEAAVSGKGLRGEGLAGYAGLLASGTNRSDLTGFQASQGAAAGLNALYATGKGYHGVRSYQMAGDILRNMGGGSALKQAAVGEAELSDMYAPSSHLSGLFGNTGGDVELARYAAREMWGKRFKDSSAQSPIFHKLLNKTADEIYKSEHATNPKYTREDARKAASAALYHDEGREAFVAKNEMAGILKKQNPQMSDIDSKAAVQMLLGFQGGVKSELGPRAQGEALKQAAEEQAERLRRTADQTAATSQDARTLKEVLDAMTPQTVANLTAVFSAMAGAADKIGKSGVSPAEVLEKVGEAIDDLADKGNRLLSAWGYAVPQMGAPAAAGTQQP